MTTNENNQINSLFTQLQIEIESSNSNNFKSLYSENGDRQIYNQIFEENLQFITIIQKRITRAFLKAGAVGELLSQIDCGTLPPLRS